MSHTATTLVKSRSFGNVSRKAVVLVLADYCDAEWSCFVGQERLAWESETSERTARRILAEFEKCGLITRRPRYDLTGRRTSDRIHLVPEMIMRLPVRMAGDTPDIDGSLPATGDTTTGQSLAGESLEEPSVDEPSGSSRDVVEMSFEEWWKLYPLKKAKPAALRAYRTASKDVGPVVLLDGVKRYAAERAGQDAMFTAHASTWLNQRRWEDEPSTPASGKRPGNLDNFDNSQARRSQPGGEIKFRPGARSA